MQRLIRLGPHAVVFAASMGVMVIELVAGRLVAKYLGNSLYTWTSVIGIVLGGISLGNAVGGRLADRIEPRRLIPWILLAASVLTVLIVALDLLVGLLTGAVEGMSLGILARAIALITVLFFLPSASMGMVSPVMAKYAIQASSGVGAAVGGIYAAGSLGSIAGTFAAGYLLIPAFGLTANILAVGLVLALLSLAMGGRRLLSGAWLVVLLLLLVTGAPQKLSRGIAERQARTTTVIFEKDTPYSYLQVADKASPAGRERTLRLDALVHSRHSPEDPDRLLYQYERIFAGLTAAVAGSRSGRELSTLTLGGGGFTLPMWLQRRYPLGVHAVVEIDPDVVTAAHRFFDLSRDTRLRIVIADARTYVDQARPGSYDLVYGDVFNAYSVPAHLATREFVAGIARLLAPGGVFASNVIDIFDSGRFLGAYVATLAAVFPSVTVYLPAESGWSTRATFVIAATDGPAPPAILRDADGREVAAAVSRDRLGELLDRSLKELTDDYAPVESLMAPVFLRSVR